MELQRFYTGYVSSAIPPHRYPQVYNIRIGGKRRRRRSCAAESKDGLYSRKAQPGKPSKSSPLAQVQSISLLDLRSGSLDDADVDRKMEVDISTLNSGVEFDFVPLQNPWPERSENSASKNSYERNSISLAHSQTEVQGQVYLPFQSCSDLSTTLVEPADPATPPGLEEATSTIIQLCNELEYIANSLLPKSASKTKTKTKSRPLDPSISEVLAESIIEVSLPKPGSLFDGDPFGDLPPGDTVTV